LQGSKLSLTTTLWLTPGGSGDGGDMVRWSKMVDTREIESARNTVRIMEFVLWNQQLASIASSTQSDVLSVTNFIDIL